MHSDREGLLGIHLLACLDASTEVSCSCGAHAVDRVALPLGCMRWGMSCLCNFKPLYLSSNIPNIREHMFAKTPGPIRGARRKEFRSPCGRYSLSAVKTSTPQSAAVGGLGHFLSGLLAYAWITTLECGQRGKGQRVPVRKPSDS